MALHASLRTYNIHGDFNNLTQDTQH